MPRPAAGRPGSATRAPQRAARRPRLILLALLASLSGCGASKPSQPTDDGAANDPLTQCHEQGGGDAPQQITDVVERINALPEPKSLACFLASLPRPLRVLGTTSTFSVQPATGRESPRVFIFTQGLVMAVLPSGVGSELLELGEWTQDYRTLKGEVAFPVSSALEPDAPFARLREDTGPSKCGFCHANELFHPTIEGAVESVALQVQPGTEVGRDALHALHMDCEARSDKSAACAFWRAIFGFGAVEQGAFPDETALFFEEG